MENKNLQSRIASSRGKTLFSIAAGENLTKLEIKNRTQLSMTTVISKVKELSEQGLVTFVEEKGARGGRNRSVINVHPMRRVYGVSYKSGVLSAAAVDFKGELREKLSREVPAELSPTEGVLSLIAELSKNAPLPSAIALSLNCDEKASVLSRLEDAFGVPALSASNTAAVSYLALWGGAALPVAAIGVGNYIKCALIERVGYRTIDVGALPSPRFFAGDGSYRAVLSAEKVENVLRNSDYRGHFCVDGGRFWEVGDLADYSRALSRTIALLAESVDLLLSPSEIVLFGEYLSDAFFLRIKEKVGRGNLTYLHAEREDFARGSALVALTEQFFS